MKEKRASITNQMDENRLLGIDVSPYLLKKISAKSCIAYLADY